MAKKKHAGGNAQEVQNAAKTLFANIRFMSVDNPIHAIALTSTMPNEGKTVTSLELAKAIASSGKTCLVVEADMRRRSVASALGVHSQSGIYSVLVGQVALGEAITATTTQNLYFLDAEPNIPNPADILASNRYRQFVSDARQMFDYVVFDTPPVGTFVDAAILGTLMDGVVLVVRNGECKREELVVAYDQLKKADANVIGICSTFCEGTGSEYYYAYYTKDGARVNSAEARAAERSQAASAGRHGVVGARNAR